MQKRPYLTVSEMRAHPEWVEEPPKEGRFGTRYHGSTETDFALPFLRTSDRVLECGPLFGQFTKVLQDKGFSDLHTLDFFDALTFPDRARLTSAIVDFNTDPFPYPDQYFDAVTAWGIVEHMENPYHFMREVWRTTKPGGFFFLSVPNVFHITSRLNFLFTGIFPRWNANNNHIFLLTRGILDKTFLRYFTLEEIRYTKPGNVYTKPGTIPRGPIYKFFDALFKTFPANEWFGNYVVYVLRPKPASEAL